jgi:hypothetical protein
MIAAQGILSTNFVKALSAGDLIKNIFIIYRKHFWKLLVVSGIAAALASAGPAVAGAVVLVCSRAILGKPIKLFEIYKNMFRSSYIVPIFLFGLLMIPVAIPIYIPAISNNLLILHFLLAILSLLTIFFASIVLIEKRQGDAFGRFSTLLFSNFWSTIGKFFISYIIYIVIFLFVYTLSGFALVFLLGQLPPDESPYFSQIGWIASTLSNPILYLSAVFLYYDVRVREENFTEELLAEELGYHADVEMIST